MTSPTVPKRSTLAVISLSLGIAGVFFNALTLGLFPIGAIATGIAVRVEIRKSPDTVLGNGFAFSGIVLGVIGLILSLLVAILLTIVGRDGLAPFIYSVF